MVIRRSCVVATVAIVVVASLLASCASNPSASPSTSASHKARTDRSRHPAAKAKKQVPPQSPAPVENNPPGDIPDNTVFVPYRSSQGGFHLRVPEGWSRRQSKSAVSFKSALNEVTVTWAKEKGPLSVSRVRSQEVPTLKQTVPAFALRGVKQTRLPGGTSVLLTYESNSTRNAVTGKRYRLIVLRFEFVKNGRQADLSLSSPVGADNVDPWRTISQSFGWN